MIIPREIFLFLTGREDIESLQQVLEERLKLLPDDAMKLLVCPIFAALPTEDQMRAFEPAPAGHRKVILATNIAETSLTINGIRYVIDSGLVKIRKYDPGLGMDSLILVPVSKAQAQQRAGRAGREAPGICFRLYTEEDYTLLKDYHTPEIQRCNLAHVLLQIKGMNIEDINNFPFLDSPSKSSINRGLFLLKNLGAFDSNNSLTELGKQMAKLPVDPMFAKVILTASNHSYAHCCC